MQVPFCWCQGVSQSTTASEGFGWSAGMWAAPVLERAMATAALSVGDRVLREGFVRVKVEVTQGMRRC